MTYDGVQNRVYLALSDWEGGVWHEWNSAVHLHVQTDGMYTAADTVSAVPDGVWAAMHFAAASQSTSAQSHIHQDDGDSQEVRGRAADSLAPDEVLFSGAATSTAQNECLVAPIHVSIGARPIVGGSARSSRFTFSKQARNTVCIWHFPAEFPARGTVISSEHGGVSEGRLACSMKARCDRPAGSN